MAPRILALPLALALSLSAPPMANEAKQETIAPQVLSIGMPYYPVVARASHVQGVVQVEVTTNGESVKTAQIIEGDRLLARFAEANVRTWTFVEHEPAKFIVTYRYKLVDHLDDDHGYGAIVLHLPNHVEVSAKPIAAD